VRVTRPGARLHETAAVPSRLTPGGIALVERQRGEAHSRVERFGLEYGLGVPIGGP
jgi:hypothetical protein